MVMKCPDCYSDVQDKWAFCPKCGHSLEKMEDFGDLFESLFSKVSEEFSDMDEIFEKDIEALDISPWFKKPKGKGFSIKIVASGNKPPKVEVHSFGGFDENKLKKDIYNQIGVESKGFEMAGKAPKITEEPKAKISRYDGKVLVELDLKGVRSEEEIKINELENSVEVKAVVGDKAYFKILTKPNNTSITKRRFDKGLLALEFS